MTLTMNFWTFVLALAAMYCILEIFKNLFYTIALAKYLKAGKDIDEVMDEVDKTIETIGKRKNSTKSNKTKSEK